MKWSRVGILGVSFISVSIFLAAMDATGDLLDEKLSAQFDTYRNATIALLTRLEDKSRSVDERVMSRVEWEELLKLKGSLEFTENDLNELKARQLLRIENAKRLAQAMSRIDLQRFRRLVPEVRLREIRSFCEGFPKGAMLHVHPLGTGTRDTIAKLLTTMAPLEISNEKLTSVGLYEEEKEWLSTHLGKGVIFSNLEFSEQVRFLDFFALPMGKPQPFPRFEAVFPFVRLLRDHSRDAHKIIIEDFIKRAVEQKVSYVEFTTWIDLYNPTEIARFSEIARALEAKYPILIRYNIAFVRTKPVADLRAEAIQLLKSKLSDYIVGIDFMADESPAPALEKGQEIYGRVLSARISGKSHLHSTMHAGEIGNPSNPRDAILMGAQRLGHGVQLRNDPVALEYALHKGTAIEVNLVSNVKLGAVRSIEAHPFLDFLRLGLPVSLSTDDEGIFRTDISHECVEAIQHSDVSYWELQDMAFQSISASFLPKKLKWQLIDRLFDQFAEFEVAFLKKTQVDGNQ